MDVLIYKKQTLNLVCFCVYFVVINCDKFRQCFVHYKQEMACNFYIVKLMENIDNYQLVVYNIIGLVFRKR